MKKIVFAKNAEEDIKQIFQFNYALNKFFAKKNQKRIFEEVKVLINFPESAPIEPLLEHKTETFRSLVIVDGRYKVIYVVKEEQVLIYVVLYCRKNPLKMGSNII